jgi:hypothetical protein
MNDDSISWLQALLLLALAVVSFAAANECCKVPVINRWGETEHYQRGDLPATTIDRYDDRQIEATPAWDERREGPLPGRSY